MRVGKEKKMSTRWIAGIFMTGDTIPLASDDKIGTLYGWKIHPNFFVEFFNEKTSKIIEKLDLVSFTIFTSYIPLLLDAIVLQEDARLY